MRKICFAILLVPALAWAQPRTAADWYKEGENQYLLGNFDKAVEAFKQGFSLETDGSKRAAYLYNVAQSYRQANDCGHALFFYRRFLALKEGDTVKPLSAQTRKEVGDWIRELEVCVQQATAVGKRPPNTNLPPDGEGSDKPVTSSGDAGRTEPPKKPIAAAGTEGPGGDNEDHGETPEPDLITVPHVFATRFTFGGTVVSAGALDIPVQVTFALTGGYPIPVNNRLTIDVGAAFTFTPVPDHIERPDMQPVDVMVRMFGLMANVDARYEVIPKLELRGDVGLGALFLSNVSETKFIDEGRKTDGALTMFHLRAAASVDYAFTRNLIGTITPIAFTYSPAKKGLETSIKNITSIDFMLGIGYQM